jgi:hypothetical protein
VREREPLRWAVVGSTLLLSLAWLFIQWKTLQGFDFTASGGPLWGVADDVYISADFGRTLAHGGGPRWFPGAPKVEGFTSPLWTLLLAGVELLPGASGKRLGLAIFAVNAVVLVALARTVVGVLVTLPPPGNGRKWALSVGLPVAAISGVAISYWAGNGFETPLVGLLSLAAFDRALREDDPWSSLKVGALTALGAFTRLDALLYCGAPLLYVTFAGPRARSFGKRLAGPAVVAVSLACQFVGRFLYYGEWLPNTYYLKATGWALRERTLQGWWQNAPALIPLIVFLLPVTAVLLPRLERREIWRVVIPLGVFVLSVAYSTSLGGDLAYEVYGYDRFTSIGAVFLSVGLPALFVGAANASRPGRLAGACAALAVAASPVWLRPDLMTGRLQLREPPHLAGLRTPLLVRDTLTLTWIRYGEAVARITRPRATVAVCAAGATVYFSNRRAVDILGKVDKRIARLRVPPKAPPDARCWRGYPGAGHNKEDVRGTFGMYAPDVALVAPPAANASSYRAVAFDGLPFWVRIGSSVVRWDRLQP